MTTETGTDLIALSSLSAVEVFSKDGGLDPILDRIEKEVRAIITDVSTHKGREEIRSIAYKVKKSRTTLFKMAKDLTEDWREQTKKVTAERNRMEEKLLKLEEEVRAPLTEFENKEKNRVQAHEDALLVITQMADLTENVLDIETRIASIDVDARDWEEFSDRARRTKEEVRSALAARLEGIKKAEADRLELERLRKAEEERLRKEREEQIAKEAAEKARIEAERVAKEAADKEAARVKAEAEKAEIERKRIESERIAAEERAAKAEADRVAAEKKAKDDAAALAAKVEADRIAAEEKAKRDAEAAAKAERDRIEAENKRIADETAKREADLAHRKKINNEAKDALISQLSTDGVVTINLVQAEAIVRAIAKGLIPHVKINY